MRLVEFRIKNFRSVNGDHLVEVREQTALVGRNESGKTNLLLALQSLNPPEGRRRLSDVKDFPRDRPVSGFTEDIGVVETTWNLTDEEQKELAAIYPRAAHTSRVAISRAYEPAPDVIFDGLPELQTNEGAVSSDLRRVADVTSSRIEDASPDAEQQSRLAVQTLRETMLRGLEEPISWASQAITAITTFRTTLTSHGITPTQIAETSLLSLETLAQEINNDVAEANTAKEWILSKLPVFIYVADYPELDGHHNISRYLNRLAGSETTDARQRGLDVNFSKLLKVAGLDANALKDLLQQDHEMRQQMANRAGAVVTKSFENSGQIAP